MGARSHIAELLRAAREQRGLSTEIAAAQSGIPLRYVQLLEGETPTIGIPDEFYLIPFFRKYASFVGLEVERLLPEFLGQVQHVPANPPAPAPLVLRRPFALAIDSLWKPIASVLAVTLAVFLMTRNAPEPAAIAMDPGGASGTAERTGSPNETTGNLALPIVASSGGANETVERPAATSEVAGNPPPPTAAVGVADAAPAAMPRADTAPLAVPASGEPAAAADTSAVGPRKLHILATEPVWLEVGRDDGPGEEFWLDPGDTHTWTANESFTLKVGNAGGVSLAFNGRKLPPLGRSGQVVRVRLPHPTAQANGG